MDFVIKTMAGKCIQKLQKALTNDYIWMKEMEYFCILMWWAKCCYNPQLLKVDHVTFFNRNRWGKNHLGSLTDLFRSVAKISSYSLLGGGGYSSMIWVGMCHWDLKSRPIFIPNFTEKTRPIFRPELQISSKIY